MSPHRQPKRPVAPKINLGGVVAGSSAAEVASCWKINLGLGFVAGLEESSSEIQVVVILGGNLDGAQ